MSKKTSPIPTETELEILNIMWKYGPSTVRFVNDKRSERMKVGYTTTLKLMQIMTEKKMVKRDEKSRTHIYRPALKEGETRRVLVDKFLKSVFGGSAAELVTQTFKQGKFSEEEIKTLKKIIYAKANGKK